MLKNKKQWALTVLTGTSYILSLSGTMLAQASQVPTGPLSPNNPAAKLDQSLVNVPAKTAPASAGPRALSNNTPVSVVGHDLKTGKTSLSSSLLAANSSASSQVSPSNPGLSPTFSAEPRSGVHSQTAGAKPNNLNGPDDRVKITATTTYPWRVMTKLYVTYGNGKTYVCSGALIAAKYVLTAGNCIYSKSDGGWAKTVEVIPGLNGTYKPYGSAYATYLRSYTGWTSNEDSNYDIGLVTLDRTIGNTTGWLGYGYYSSINGVTGNLAGYPVDKDYGLGLYYHYGSITSSTSYRIYYQIDTYYGQSGSPVYKIDNDGNRYVFGVHSSTAYNSGTRIDSKKYNDIKTWISSGT
jgi:glutamyl endopeptidase